MKKHTRCWCRGGRSIAGGGVGKPSVLVLASMEAGRGLPYLGFARIRERSSRKPPRSLATL